MQIYEIRRMYRFSFGSHHRFTSAKVTGDRAHDTFVLAE